VKPGEFLQAIDDARIVAAIREAEARSRGEIRVHVSEGDVEDAQAAAEKHFERLGMTRTAERNGVLIFVAPTRQRFAVLGDRGVHERCPEGFWAEVAGEMRESFRTGAFTEGIVAAVARVGDELARHFPRRPGETDENELPDAVSRG
jgi:uncharacterized membrane protein